MHGAGCVCVVLGMCGAGWGGCIASSGHVVIVVAVLWPCGHCCCCGTMAVATGIMSSLSSLWCGHVAVIVVVVVPWQWPQASHRHHCHCGVAMSPSSSSLWHRGSGHRHHIVVVAVVWPCHRHCHSMVMLSLSSAVLWWDHDGERSLLLSLVFAMALAMGIASLSSSLMLLVAFGCWTYHCRPRIVSILAPSSPVISSSPVCHPCSVVDVVACMCHGGG